jgi:cell division protein FtsZ
VRTIMSGMGMALMGTGIASGPSRALEAAQKAISSPLLEDATIDGARGILINITGGPDMTLHEVAEASSLVQRTADPEANIIFGTVIDKDMTEQIKITVIATGFSREDAARIDAARSGAGARPADKPVPAPAPRRDIETPAFLRRSPSQSAAATTPAAPGGSVPVPEGSTSLHYAPMPDDLEIPTFLRRQMD